MITAKNIKITGIVQGVGFRPFVCKTAKKYNINGWVLNDSAGVYIHAEGNNEDINSFTSELKNNPPALAIIISFIIEDSTKENYSNFTIHESHKTDDPLVFISPDVCTCDDCKNEILDKNNKRYYYPFTNCTNCGPRFSIIKEVPYDRKFTTMNDFKQCKSCMDEYTSIDNRRFHAQPNCCNECGPSLSILDSYGKDLTLKITKDLIFNSSEFNKTLITFFQDSIIKGDIWAVKSITGFHLCCNPYSEKTVKLLRDRKHRPSKPLALMMKDINTIKKYCYVSKIEEEMLMSKARPIVLLKKKNNDNFPGNIAPNNKLLGVMLPSTPLHILIMNNSPFDALIMTSGNLSGLPLEYKNDSSVEHLSTFVDYFLTNNRDIVLPLDDSIMKETLSGKSFIRRSRGFVPLPLNYPNCKNILALGCDMKNTFSVSKNDYIYIGPHNGDLNNYEIIKRLKENIKRYITMFEAKPSLVVCDKHPSYESNKLSKEFNLPVVTVQHHHSHIVSCMAENNYSDKVIGIAFDGTGYGDDDCIWGSEFFICDTKSYIRTGHIDYINFLGGDSALRDGYKIALSYLYKVRDSDSKEKIINKYYRDSFEIIFKLLKYNKFSYLSSSIGRLFDGVSSLLGLCHHSSFEGEAAIALESILESNELIDGYPINIQKKDNMYILSPISIIENILIDLENNISNAEISHKFHSTIVNYITEMCIILRNEYSINTVALSGGVFQNDFLITNTYNELTKNDFKVLIHRKLPCNDGGISVGQIIIAKELT